MIKRSEDKSDQDMEIMKSYDEPRIKVPRHKQASSRDDKLETPIKLYQFLCKKHKIECELDPFASDENHKCEFYFTYEQNAFNLEYLIPNGKKGDKKPKGVYVNHPHTLHEETLEHNEIQWLRHDLDILMIIPANTVRPPYWTKFVGKHLHKGIEIEPLINEDGNGYINFKKGGKDTEFDSRNGYLVVRYFSKKNYTQHILKLYYNLLHGRNE